MPKGLSEGGKIRFTAIYLVTFVTCVYFISLSTFFAIDQYISRYEVTKSIAERFELSIPEGSPTSIKGVDGRTYSLYGLGWPILAVPLYMMGKIFGHYPITHVFLLNTLAGSATVTLVFLFSIGFAINTRLVSILALPALFVMMGAGCGAKCRLADYSKIFLRKMVIFISVLLPLAGLVLWYNYSRFGSIYETGFQLQAAKTGLGFFSGTPLLTGLKGFLWGAGKGFFFL